jgi:hypothetical protein
MKRKIPSPRRESNPRTSIVQPVAQRYKSRGIPAKAIGRIVTRLRLVRSAIRKMTLKVTVGTQRHPQDSVTLCGAYEKWKLFCEPVVSLLGLKDVLFRVRAFSTAFFFLSGVAVSADNGRIRAIVITKLAYSTPTPQQSSQ